MRGHHPRDPLELVIIDTSSIVFGFSFKRNVFEAANEAFPGREIVISAGVLRELRGIARNRGRRGAAAGTALLSVSSKSIKVDKDGGDVDSWIAAASARYNNSIVITNDTELLGRIRRSGGKALKLSKSGILKG